MRPRVGHIVWYRTESWKEGPLTDYAAIVTRVAQGEAVDLIVFDPMSDPYHRSDVRFDPSGEHTRTWRWPIDAPTGGPYR